MSALTTSNLHANTGASLSAGHAAKWVAVGAAGAVVLAFAGMGVAKMFPSAAMADAGLVRAVTPQSQQSAMPGGAAALAQTDTATSATSATSTVPAARSAAANKPQVRSGNGRATSVASRTPSVPLATSPVVAQTQRVIDPNAGTVESVTPVTKKGDGTGIGAVAGGVLGGVLGRQIGKGSGRDVATVIGAVGGGVAGHHIEKNVRAKTVYQVRVRMDDGSSRTIEQATAPSVGARVTLDGNQIRGSGASQPQESRATVQPYQRDPRYEA